MRYTNTNQDKLKHAWTRNFGAKKSKENAYKEKMYIVYTSANMYMPTPSMKQKPSNVTANG